jgi:hypothetical protein
LGTDVLVPGSGGVEVVGVTLGSVVSVVDGLVTVVVILEVGDELVSLAHETTSNTSSSGATSAWCRLIMDLTPTT